MTNAFDTLSEAEDSKLPVPSCHVDIGDKCGAAKSDKCSSFTRIIDIRIEETASLQFGILSVRLLQFQTFMRDFQGAALLRFSISVHVCAAF